MMDYRIDFAVQVKVLSQPMNFTLSVSLVRKRKIALVRQTKKSLTLAGIEPPLSSVSRAMDKFSGHGFDSR